MNVYLGSRIPALVNLNLYKALDDIGLFAGNTPEDVSLQPFETSDIKGECAVLTVRFRPAGGAVRNASFVVSIDHHCQTVHVYSFKLDVPPVYQVGRKFGTNEPSTHGDLLDVELLSLLSPDSV